MSEQPEGVQLRGDELQQMNKMASSVEAQLLEIAKIIHSKVPTKGDATERKGRRPVARVYLNNLRVVVDDENGCGVYELPPGICRPCRPGE